MIRGQFLILLVTSCLGLFRIPGTNVFAQTESQEQPVAKETQEIPAEVYDKVRPATVRIICDDGAEIGSGTIVGLTKQNRALILTCCHVIAKNFAETDQNISLEFFANINVKTASEVKPLAASVLLDFVDRANDIAIISTTEAVSEAQLIAYTLSDKIKPGQAVGIFGFPNTDEINQTVGNFSRIQGNYLVIKAALATGNSGGPVVDKKGRMIGMATYVEEKEGYAVSMNLVSSVVNYWLQNLKLKRAWQLEKDSTLLTRTYSDWRFLAAEIFLASGLYLLLKSEPPTKADIEDPPSLP